MARRLKTIAKEINAIDGLNAEVVQDYCNTDRKIPGTRLISPGKGRRGNRIIIKDDDGHVLFDHSSAQTYRRNSEVEGWLAHWKENHHKFTKPREGQE